MVEGDHSKLAPPLESDAQPTQEGQDLVTEVLATFETLVAVTPGTVRRTNAFWLPENVFEGHLKSTIK